MNKVVHERRGDIFDDAEMPVEESPVVARGGEAGKLSLGAGLRGKRT